MSAEASAAVLFGAIFRLFLISAGGYLAVRLRILPDRVPQLLSRYIIYISLPCLIISTLGTRLRHEILGGLALAFLAALALNVLSIIIALIFRKLFLPADIRGRRIFVSLSSMQNTGYLPIPLVAAVLPEQLRSEGLLLTFVYMMVMGLIFWSLGVWLISEGHAPGWRENLKKIANPPILSLLLGLLFLIPAVRESFASLDAIRMSLEFIGNTTIPLVMIVLGASFGEKISPGKDGKRIAAASSAVKLAIVPAAALMAIHSFSLRGTFAFILALQAAMPAAINHIVIAREFSGDVPFTGYVLFVQYVLSIVTVPVFLYLYTLFS